MIIECILSIRNHSAIQSNVPRNGLDRLDSSPNLDSLDYCLLAHCLTKLKCLSCSLFSYCPKIIGGMRVFRKKENNLERLIKLNSVQLDNLSSIIGMKLSFIVDLIDFYTHSPFSLSLE